MQETSSLFHEQEEPDLGGDDAGGDMDTDSSPVDDMGGGDDLGGGDDSSFADAADDLGGDIGDDVDDMSDADLGGDIGGGGGGFGGGGGSFGGGDFDMDDSEESTDDDKSTKGPKAPEMPDDPVQGVVDNVLATLGTTQDPQTLLNIAKSSIQMYVTDIAQVTDIVNQLKSQGNPALQNVANRLVQYTTNWR